jgi:lantibiotic modifying enzyme
LGSRLEDDCFGNSNFRANFTLAKGWSGYAIAFQLLYRRTDDVKWRQLCQRALKNAIWSLEDCSNPSLGLFGGLAGLFAIRYCVDEAGASSPLSLSASKALELNSAVCLDNENFGDRNGTPWSSYDVISGMSGLLLASLDHLQGPRNSLPSKLAKSLSRLLEPYEGDPEHAYTPAAAIDSDHLRRQFNSGGWNTGLAHGIAGLVASLSIYVNHGYRDDSLDALAYASDWLMSIALSDSHGCYWNPCHSSNIPFLDPERMTNGWCYGSPGISMALVLAGKALQRGDLVDSGVSAFLASLGRKRPESVCLCHGSFGVYQIAKRLQGVVHHPLIQEYLDDFDDTLEIAFSKLPVLGPELLEGYSGTLCVLADDMDQRFPWDRILGLA